MAVDLAEQFQRLPVDEAATQIRQHIVTFWDPRIRAELVEEVDGAAAPVDPVVRRVAALLGGAPSAEG